MTAPQQTTPGNQCRRILVVDDHKDTARMLQLFIAAAGHDVRTAGTKAAALVLADNELFDVVVCDLRLPDGSGHDLIRELQARHAVKGIAFSGLSGPEEEARCRTAGFSALLIKPQDLDRLLDTIEQVAEID